MYHWPNSVSDSSHTVQGTSYILDRREEVATNIPGSKGRMIDKASRLREPGSPSALALALVVWSWLEYAKGNPHFSNPKFSAWTVIPKYACQRTNFL